MPSCQESNYILYSTAQCVVAQTVSMLTRDPAALRSYLSKSSFVSCASTSSGTDRLTAGTQEHLRLSWQLLSVVA